MFLPLQDYLIGVGPDSAQEIRRKVDSEIMATQPATLFEAPDEAKPTPARALLEQLLAAQRPRQAAHHQRVGAMSHLLARRIGLGEAQAEAIGRAGALRDIGMALLPQDLIDGEEALLSLREKQLVHRHCVWGHEILDLTGDPELELAATVAIQHHERWDGSGYPFGLKGEEICLAARIVAICAVYEALRHSRPGGAALDHVAALAALRAGDHETSPTAFDPAVRKLFFLYHEDLRRIGGTGGRLALAA